MKKVPQATTLGAVGLCMSFLAEASMSNVYFGASALQVDRPKYNDVDKTQGVKGLIGFRFKELPLFIEASYIDTGKADIDPLPGAFDGFDIKFSGATIGLGTYWAFTETGTGLWLRANYYTGDSKIGVPIGSLPDDLSASGTLKESANGYGVGIGLTWKFTPWIGLRLESESLVSVKDFASDENVHILSAGLIFEFPVGRSGGSTFAPSPEPSPVGGPSASDGGTPLQAERAPLAAPPPPPPPAAAQPAQSSARGQIALRAQPRINSATVNVLPAHTALRTLRTLSNADGQWRYVTAGGANEGWVLDR